MPLTNTQYNELLRSYDEKQLASSRDLDRRREEVYAALPEVRAVDEQIAHAALDAARAIILDPDRRTPALPDTIRTLKEKRASLLLAAGLPENALEPVYECPYCLDTGFVNGEKCRCFKEAETRLLYDHSLLTGILEKENFEHFSLSWYSDTMKDGKTGYSARQYAENALMKARRTAAHLCEEGSDLFLYGKAGLGKTFLTHCIAAEALKKQRPTLYFSAPEFVELCEKAAFGDGGSGTYEQLLTADLLILDDLGTELTNTFVHTELFRIVSGRLARRRTTVISTNLSLEEFRDLYTERIFSRIAASYQIVKLVGDDIRLQIKRNGGMP